MTAVRISAFVAAFYLLGFAPAPATAASFRAELTSGDEIVGQMTDFRDGYYEFQTGTTVRRIKLQDLKVLSLAEAEEGEPDSGTGQSAKIPEFTLQERTGKSISGQIVEFQEGYYLVATAAGTVRVPVSDVTGIALTWQEKGASTTSQAPVARLSGTLRIRASAEAVERLVPELLQFYAQISGQTGRWLPRHTDGSRTYSVGSSAEQEQLRFELKGDDPDAAIAAVLAGEAELAVVVGESAGERGSNAVTATAAKSATSDSRTSSSDAGAPASEPLRLGVAGVVVIVNAENPVDRLTYEQIAGIFSGKITNWSQLGGPHRRIRVHALAQPSGLNSIAKKTVLKDSTLMLSAYQVDTLSELAEVVSSDPTAIGLTEASSVGNAKSVQVIDECGIARTPDELSMKLRSYPLTASFLVYAAADPQAQKFRDFLRSDLTQSHLKSRRLPNDRVVAARSPGLTINATQDARAVPAAAGSDKRDDNTIERVSVVFSFASGSVTPASDSAEKIEGLKAFLNDRDGGPRRIAVVGFSDGLGNTEQNIAISDMRARNVQALLSAHGVKAEKILALGPMFPIACEASLESVELNRRVELWLY